MLGREFILRTDHGSLVWPHKFKEPGGQIARWLLQLTSYNFQTQHRPRKHHGNADGLSKIKTRNGKCKQYKANVTEQSDDTKYYHIKDLRKAANREDNQSCKYVCDIKALFYEVDQDSNECDSNDAIQSHRMSKLIPNRPA